MAMDAGVRADPSMVATPPVPAANAIPINSDLPKLFGFEPSP